MITQTKKPQVIVPLLQGIVGCAILTAALIKLSEGVSSVHAAILVLGVLSPEWSGRVSLALPVFELAVAVWLISGGWPRAAALAAVGMLAVFSAALIGLGVKLGWRADCGCNVLLLPTTIGMALARNAVLLALLAVLLVILNGRMRALRTAARPVPAA